MPIKYGVSADQDALVAKATKVAQYTTIQRRKPYQADPCRVLKDKYVRYAGKEHRVVVVLGLNTTCQYGTPDCVTAEHI